MKVETKVLSDARLSISVVENDGTPVATRELSFNAAVNLFARWAFTYLPTANGQALIVENGNKELHIVLRETPHPEKDAEAEEANNGN